MSKTKNLEIVRPCRKCGELYNFPAKAYPLDWEKRIAAHIPRPFKPPRSPDPIEWVCFECREFKPARLSGWICKECGEPFQTADFLGPQEFCDGCGGDEEIDLLKPYRSEVKDLGLGLVFEEEEGGRNDS
jgi:hypothetical protein